MLKRDHSENRSVRKNKRGRPSTIEKLDDPHLPLKASLLHNMGRSWAETASLLGVSRTTAKRLATMYQKENKSQIDGESKNNVQEDDDKKQNIEDNQSPELSIHEGFLEYLPKTFKIFVSLVKRARETR